MSNAPNHAARVNLHVTKLASLAERSVRTAFLDNLVSRRQRRQDDVGGLERFAIEAVPRFGDDDDPVPIVKDEVLVIEADQGRRNRVRTQLDGFDSVTQADLPPGVLRLRARRPTQSRERVRSLRKGGFNVSPNHVAVLGGTIKGGATPELTDEAPPPMNHSAATHPLVIVIDTGAAAATLGMAAAPQANRDDHWLNQWELADGDNRNIDPLDVLAPSGLDLAAGHGTFVAGVVRQVSGSARIVMVRAFDTDGVSTEATIAQSIMRAATIFEQNGGGGVLNLSFGLETIDGQEPAVLRAALDQLPDNVLVVAAAGNAPINRPFWPAASDRVLGVAALKEDGTTPAEWSNYGPWVDVSVRGEGVVSPFVEGVETQGSGAPGDPFDPQPDTFLGPNPFAVWSGTSFATAQVAGQLANMLADDPELSRDEATSELQARGTASQNHGSILSIL